MVYLGSGGLTAPITAFSNAWVNRMTLLTMDYYLGPPLLLQPLPLPQNPSLTV